MQPYEELLLKFFIKVGRLQVLEHRRAFRELGEVLFPAGKEPLAPDDAIGFIDYKTLD